ncbi:hypothetical protein ACLOJK_022122, partial [Asimina triloba]
PRRHHDHIYGLSRSTSIQITHDHGLGGPHRTMIISMGQVDLTSIKINLDHVNGPGEPHHLKSRLTAQMGK